MKSFSAVRYHAILLLVASIALTSHFSKCFGQGTTVTYQGRLDSSGSPANGLYDFTFSAYSTNVDGIAEGSLTNLAVLVANGLFTTLLDFGAPPDGRVLWLELGVRTNGVGGYTTLSPRQLLSPTPYALFAMRASNVVGTINTSNLVGSINANQISGSLAVSQLPAAVVTNGAGGVNFTGTFSGDGTGISNVDLITGNSHAALSWSTNYPGVFTLTTNMPTGGGLYPLSASVADANGDGSPDLIVANQGGNTISTLTNNGHGLFSRQTYIYPGDLSPQFALGLDMNGDGTMEIVCGSAGLSKITTLTNYLGQGIFNFYTNLTVPNFPRWLTAADVNSDGKIDIISADLDSSLVMICTNRGDGSLATSGFLSVSLPLSVFAADVNADGKPDLITCNAGGNTISIATNVNGAFGIKTNIYAGAGLENVAVADINGDGRPDVVATLYASTLVTFLNVGNGNYVSNWSGTTASAGQPISLALADVNQDGKPDAIIGHTATNRLCVLTNDGAGRFLLCSRPLVSTNPAFAGTNIVFITTGDLNGDGRTDIVAVNNYESTVAILLNSPAIQASFVGDGANLTGLNAANIGSGTLADARLSPNVAFLSATQTFTGANVLTNAANSFAGSGAGLLNLNAAALSYGTVPDARLSTNVPLRNANQSFSGTNIFTAAVGIGTNNPQSALQVQGTLTADALRASGATGTTFAFIHRAVATNTGGNVTTIYHPLTDGDANALLFVTHNYNADTNAVSSYNTNAVGVWYDGTHWTIYNENNFTPMPLGRAFNVLVIKR